MEPIPTQPQPPAVGQTLGTNQPVDPTALALSRSIRQVESGGDYNAIGDNGSSHGAYQFHGSNFQDWAKQYGLNPEDMSQTNQDHVAYMRIKSMLDEGNSQSEVAARWNGAKMVNGKYEAINPAYVTKVKNAYMQHSQNVGQSQDPSQLAPGVPALSIASGSATPSNGQPQEQGLSQQLSGRATDASQAINDTLAGKINPLSGVLQTAGAVAGGVGDIVNKGLELIPGFKGIEGLIGQGVGALAQTSAGQSIGKAVQSFSAAHPELSKDIGAGFNIATALPIFEGLGALKNVALDSASMALKNVAEKGVTKSLTEDVFSTLRGAKVLAQNKEGMGSIIENRFLPKLRTVGNRTVYDSAEAIAKTSDAIGAIDEKELQPILERVSQQQNFGQHLATLKKIAIKEAENDPMLREAGVVPQAIKQIENRFAGWQYSYGDTVNLATENRLKIGSGKFSDWMTPEGSADKAIYRAFQHNIEEVAAKNGMGNVALINQKMSKMIQAKEMLQYIDNKPIKKVGLIHNLISGAATAGGEIAGNAAQIPIAGAIIGNRTSGLIEKSLGGLTPRALRTNILERTAEGATRQTATGMAKKSTGLIGAAIAGQANRRSNR